MNFGKNALNLYCGDMAMKYVHFGMDYKELISSIPDIELEKLGVTNEKYLVPLKLVTLFLSDLLSMPTHLPRWKEVLLISTLTSKTRSFIS